MTATTHAKHRVVKAPSKHNYGTRSEILEGRVTTVQVEAQGLEDRRYDVFLDGERIGDVEQRRVHYQPNPQRAPHVFVGATDWFGRAAKRPDACWSRPIGNPRRIDAIEEVLEEHEYYTTEAAQ